MCACMRNPKKQHGKWDLEKDHREIEGGTKCVRDISSSAGLAARRYSIFCKSTARLTGASSTAGKFPVASVMSYYMDPVSSYPALHPCDRLGTTRPAGGVAVGPETHLPGVVHPQQQFYPSQPLHPHDIPLQEVPDGRDMCPTGRKETHLKSNRLWFQSNHAVNKNFEHI
nr:uncharacterized protein LOC107380701 [Nothobranchius furzeri]